MVRFLNNLQQRIESLKAGAIAGCAFSGAYLLAMAVNSLILAQQFSLFHSLRVNSLEEWLVRGATAGLCGFLFGVTYRYIIRDDHNPHLRSGAVFAFGLVRGFALVDLETNLLSNFGNLAILGLESLWGFAVARLALDFFLARQWLQPFRTDEEYKIVLSSFPTKEPVKK